MNWVMKVTYKDGKEMNILLPKEEVDKFLDCYKNKKEYWSLPSKGTSFMAAFDEVRALVWGKETLPQNVAKEENKEDKPAG